MVSLTANSESDPFVGRLIRDDRIQLQDLIGGGGMGRVYRGVDRVLGRIVAVKILHPEHQGTEAARVYFEREARAASKLWHPNIIQIIEYGAESDGTLCLVMEYAPGRTLADVIEQDFPLPTERSVRILTQILTALEVAHNAGIVHRDLKPENIMLQDVPGNPDFAKVLDFGVAKAMELDAAGPMTMAGMVMGTPHFMSPEQAYGRDTDARSDLYSMGAILYQMLTQELPFEGKVVMHVLTRVISERPEPPSKRRPDVDIDPSLEQICLRAMRKNVEGRFQTAAEFREALIAIGSRKSAPAHRPKSSMDLSPSDLEPFRNRARSNVAESVFDFVALHRSQTAGDQVRCAVMAVHVRIKEGRDAGYEVRLRNDFRQTFDEVVHFHTGVSAGHVGLVSTAVFGYPRTSDDDIRSAVSAAEALRQTLAQHRLPLTIGIGIAAGTIFVPSGDISAAYGEPLEQALQLANMADDRILADESAYRGGTQIRFLSTEVSGIYVPRLEERAQVERRSSPLQVNLPLLGREEEVAFLRKMIQRVVEGKPVSLAITGPQGSGKSRMLSYLARTAEAQRVALIHASSERFPAALPALALARLVRGALELVPADSLVEAMAKLDLDDESIQVLERLLQGAAPLDFANNWVDMLTCAGVALLRALSRRLPVLILSDDFEAIDMVSFTVMNNLADALSGERCGLVVAGMSESPLSEAFAAAHHGLPLAPISADAIARFLWESFPELDEVLARQVIKLTQGSPESVCYMVEYLRTHTVLSADALPKDPFEVLAFHLESLPESARKLAAIAGVLGASFPLDALAGACPKSWDLRANLQTIGQAHLFSIHEDEDRIWLRFEPGHLADLARAQVMEDTLLKIHRRVATYYERTRGEKSSPDHDFQWARQLAACGDLSESVQLYAMAAEKVMLSYGPVATLPVVDALLNQAHQTFPMGHPSLHIVVLKASFYLIKADHHQDALDLLFELPPTNKLAMRCETEVLKGECLLRLNRVNEAAQVLGAIIPQIPESLKSLLAHAHICMASVYEHQNALRECAAAAHAAMDLLKQVREPLGPLHREQAWKPALIQGRVYLQVKQFGRAIQAFELALAGANEAADVIGQMRVWHIIATAHRAQENLQEAVHAYQQAIDAASRCGDVSFRLRLLHEVAVVYLERGEREAAREALNRSLILAQNLGSVEMVRYNEMWLRRVSDRSERRRLPAVPSSGDFDVDEG